MRKRDDRRDRHQDRIIVFEEFREPILQRLPLGQSTCHFVVACCPAHAVELRAPRIGINFHRALVGLACLFHLLDKFLWKARGENRRQNPAIHCE